MDLTGVDIMLDEKTFKSTYQIIKELSEVWNELSDVTQANVTGLIAGKRNANVVQALMTNFQDAENAMQTAANATGSAFAENEKYLDSIAGRIEVLKGQFEAFGQGIMGDGLVKFFVSLATEVLKFANALEKVHVLIPTITAVTTGFIGRGLVNDVASLTMKTQALIKAGSEASAVGTMLSGSLAGLSAGQKTLLASQLQSMLATEGLSDEYRAQISSVIALITADAGLAGANMGVAASFKAIWTAMPMFAKLAIIGVAIASLVNVINGFTKSAEEMKEEAKSIVDTFSNAQKEYRDNSKSLDDLSQRYYELSKGVGENGENISLTAAEYEEYQNILQQIIGISPGIVSTYDEQGQAVLRYKDALSGAITEQEKYLEGQRDIYLGSGQNLFDGLHAQAVELNQKLLKAGDDLQRALGIGNADVFADAMDAIGGNKDHYLTIENLEKIYENSEAFMTTIRNSGRYSADSIREIQMAIKGLSDEYIGLQDVDSQATNWLMEFIKDESWYENVPQEALDELRAGIDSVTSGLAPFNQNMSNAAAYGNEFAEAIGSEAAQSLRQLADGLADGEGDTEAELKAYNEAVREFAESFEGSPEVLAQLMSYFYGFTNAAKSGGPAVDATTTSVEGLKEALDQLKTGYELLNKAKGEMDSDGGLSADTVKSVQDALSENEKLTDYLYAENGAVKLNAEAWEARSRAMAEQKLDYFSEQYDSLSGLQEKINTPTEQLVEIIESINDLTLHETLGEILEEQFSIGNVDLLSRKILSGADMLEAGYTEFADALDEIVTLYSSTFTAGGPMTDFQFKDKNGVDIPVVIDVTPVDADGNVLSESELQDYLTELFKISDDAFDLAKNDMEGRGLILNIEELIADESGSIDWGAAIDAHEIWAQILHSISAAFEQANLGEASKTISQYLFDMIETAWNNPELESQMMSEVYTVLDYLGKALAAKGMPELSDAMAGLNIDSIINSSEAVDNLTETIQLIELLEAMLNSAGANTDPFNLSSMFTDMDKVGDKASTLVKALEDIGEGNLQDWTDLMEKFPELMDISGLFDINTLEGQEAAISGVLEQLEADYDAVIEKRIEMLRADREAAASQEGTDEETLTRYDTLIANLEKLKAMTLGQIFGTKVNADPLKELNDALNEFSTAVSNAKSAQSVLDDIASGQKTDLELLEEVVDLAKKSGKPLETFLSGFDGSKIDFNEEAIEEQINTFLDTIKKFEEADTTGKYAGLTEQVKQWIGEGDVEEPLSKLENAMSRAEKIISLIKDVNENGVSSSTISTLQDLFGEDWAQYLDTDAVGNYTGILTGALMSVADSELMAEGATRGLQAIFRQMFKDAVEGSEEAKNGIDMLTESLSGLKDALGLRNDIRSGNGDPLSMLEKAMEIAKNVEGIKITDLIQFDENGRFDFSGAGDTIQKYIDSLFDTDKLTERLKEAFPTMSDAEISSFVTSFKAAAQAEIEAGTEAENLQQSLNDLSSAISNASSAGSLLQDIASGEKSDLEIFQEVIQLAEAAGVGVETFISSFDGSKVQWNTDAIRAQRDEFLKAVEAFESANPEAAGITEYFKQLTEATGSADGFSEAMSNVKSALDLVRDAANNDISLDAITKMKELLGEGWEEGFIKNEAGEYIGISIEKMREYIQTQVEAGQMAPGVGAMIQKTFEDAANGIDDATSKLDEFTNAISQLTATGNLMSSIQAGTASFTDMINGIVDIAKNGNIDLKELLTFDGGTITPNIGRIQQYYDSLLSLTSLQEVLPNITEEGAAALRAYVEQANEAAAATEKFSEAMSATSTVKGFVESVKSGNADFASVLQTASELAQASGKDISDFFQVVNGEIVGNTDAAVEWLFSLIDGLEGVNGLTPELIAAWKQSTMAALESSAAYQAAADGINGVTSAIKSSVSELGLNNEQISQLTNRYKGLANFDPARLFEKTGQGIHLNTKALMEYEDAFQAQEKAMRQSELDNLVKQYKDLTDQINDTADAATQKDLYGKRAEVAAQIEALTTLQSQYDALTSKYNKWRQAQSMGEEGDMYDNITGGLEGINKLYEEGLIGTNKFKAALELMSGLDTTGMSQKELIAAFETAYPKMKRYFTDGQKGAKNFLTDLEKIGMATKNAEGGWDLAVDVEKAAEELGVSTDVIEAALRKLKDFGFDIDLSGYGSGIEAYATDIDTAIDEIKKSKQELDEAFKNGEINTQEYVDAMKVLDDYQKKLEEIQKGGSETEAPEPITLDEAIEQINTLQTAITTLTDAGIEVPVTITGDKELLEKLLGSGTPVADSEADVKVGVDSEEYDNYEPEDKEAAVKLKTTGDDPNKGTTPEDEEMTVKIVTDSSELDNYAPPTDKQMTVVYVGDSTGIDKEQIASKKADVIFVTNSEDPDSYVPSDKDAKVNYSKDSSTPDDYVPEDKDATVTYSKDSSVPDDYEPDDKGATVEYDVDDDAVQSYSPPNKSATVKYKPDFDACKNATAPVIKGKVKYEADMSGVNKAEGTAKATGTAKARGTAFNSGNYALKNDVVALSGEVGPELVVRDGRFFTVGNAGAEFFKFKSGDIIFNASQTEELLRTGVAKSNNGRGLVIGDGSAYASGTAFVTATGSGGLFSPKPKSTPQNKRRGGGSDDSGGDDSDDNSEPEKFDWIEIAIARIEAAIEKLKDTASNAFESLKKRMSAFGDQAKKIREEIDLQTKAAARYGKEAESVQLSEELKKKVREGTIDINQYDEDTQKKIDEYQKWYEKMLDCQKAAEDLKTELIEIATQKFETLEKHFDGLLDAIDHGLTMIDKHREMSEYTGDDPNFDQQAKLLDQQQSQQLEKLEELKKAREEFLKAGGDEGSEEYREMSEAIEKVEEALIDTAIAQRELAKERFEYTGEQYDQKLGFKEHTRTMNEGKLEEQRFTGGDEQKTYKKLERVQSSAIKLQQSKVDALKQSLNDAVDSGLIKKYSAAWYELQETIHAADEELQQMVIDSKQLRLDAFQAVGDKYDRKISFKEHTRTMNEGKLEEQKYTGGNEQKIYNKLERVQSSAIKLQQGKVDALKQSLQDAVDSGDIKKYSAAWYEMQGAIHEADEELQQMVIDSKKLKLDAFEAVANKYDLKQDRKAHKTKTIENNIADSRFSSAGGSGLYGGLIAAENSELDNQRKKLDALKAARDKAMKGEDGIKKGSEAWHQMTAEIEKTEEAIQEGTTSVKQLYIDAFNAVEKEYTNRVSAIEHTITTYEGMLEAAQYNGNNKGEIYLKLIDAQRATVAERQRELAALQDKMAEAVANGTEVGSEAWYELQGEIDSVSDSIQSAQTEIMALHKEAFDAIEAEYSKRIGVFDRIRSAYEGINQRSEYSGETKMFSAMIGNEIQRMAELQAERERLQNEMNAALASPDGIKEGSDAWYDMKEAIDNVDAAIMQTGINISSLYKDKFDYIAEEYERRLSGISSKLDMLAAKNEAVQYTGGAQDFKGLISGDIQSISYMQNELTELQQSMQSALNAGVIQENSAAWFEMQGTIDSVAKSIQEKENDIASTFVDAFEAIQDKYSSAIGMIDTLTKSLDAGLKEIETRGYIGGQVLYQQMKDVQQQRVDAEKQQLEMLESALQSAVDSGRIKEGSDAWVTMKQSIVDATQSIRESELALIEYDNAIRQMNWDIFDRMQDDIGGIADEAQFVIDLMGNAKMFDDRGKVTDEGRATGGLHAMRYDVSMEQAERYANEIRSLNEELANDPNNITLIDRRNALLELQRDAILAAEDEKQAIRSLVEDGIEIELESLKNLISEYENSLDAARDLYQYQKTVSKQAKEITSLEKQMAAYSGDDSEENRARVQKLTVDLADAREQLEETEYDKYISDQKKLLDELYNDYESALNSRLDNIDALVLSVVNSTNENAGTIVACIASECQGVGYTITTGLSTALSDTTGKIVTMYNEGTSAWQTTLGTAISNVETATTNLKMAGEAIGNDIIGALNADGTSISSLVSTLMTTATTDAGNITTQLSGMVAALGSEGALSQGIAAANLDIGTRMNAVDGIKTNLDSTKTLIDEKLPSLETLLGSQDETLKHTSETIDLLKTGFDSLPTQLDTGVGEMTKATTDASANGVMTLQQVGQNLGDLLNTAATNIQTSIQAAIAAANDATNSRASSQAESIKRAIHEVKVTVAKYGNNITHATRGTENRLEWIRGDLHDDLRPIKGKLSSMHDDLRPIKSKLYSIKPSVSTTYWTDANGVQKSSSTISGFSKGGFVAQMQKVALKNGDDMITVNTLKEGEAVFTESEYKQIRNLVDVIPQLRDIVDIDKYAAPVLNVQPFAGVNPRIDVGGVSIQIDHAENYEDLMRQIRNDRNFERMIGAMTYDRMMGKSSIGKKKYYN